MTDDNKIVPLPLKGKKCAQCGKPATQKYRPFCSKRCADLDLGNWFNESYTIPSDEEPEDDSFLGGEE